MAEKQTIEVTLEKHPKMEATGITIPFDVEAVFGSKRVPIKAEINGCVYRGSIVRMGEKYMLGIPKAFREEAGIAAGDNIVVTLERDIEERNVRMPDDLAAALTKSGLRETFDAMSYTHRKEQIRAVEEARAPETRLRRIAKAVEMTAGRKK